jgi:hypothetical protein
VTARALLGFLSEAEARRYFSTEVYGSPDALQHLWQRACSARARLSRPRPARPGLSAIPAGFVSEIERLRAYPPFQLELAPSGAEFQLVEIDQLVAVQTHIYIDDATPPISDGPCEESLSAMLRLCFPLEQRVPFRLEVDNEAKVVTVYTANRNLGAGTLNVRPVQGQALEVTVPLAVGLNWLHVVEFGQRYFLKDGYHRAWRLRRQGIERIPAVVSHATSFAGIGAGPGFLSESLLRSSHPPLFRDFFDNELAPVVQLRSILNVVRVSVEQFSVPRLI